MKSVICAALIGTSICVTPAFSATSNNIDSVELSAKRIKKVKRVKKHKRVHHNHQQTMMIMDNDGHVTYQGKSSFQSYSGNAAAVAQSLIGRNFGNLGCQRFVNYVAKKVGYEGTGSNLVSSIRQNSKTSPA